MIRLFNTLTRKKESFKPLKGKTVRLYTCGPTVYNYAHIGNLRSYVFADTLKRVLQYFKYRVRHVINVTDVGHLTSDADVGDDKMILGAQRERKTVWQIAEFYTDAFKKNSIDLNIVPPQIWCKATDHIYLQIALIQKLEKKGYTYCAGGNVYFDTSKLPDYGKLFGLQKGAAAVARVEKDSNKKSEYDFVLWFTKSKFQDQDMKWESPWGVGYPGWHIECSAMSTHYLGQPFDIHTGGIDHITVHHTNEIAQSEAATGKPMAQFWVHGEFLIIDAKRMGKSEGNFITLDILKEKGYDPLAYRFFLLQTHYRQQLNFTWQSLDAAQNGYRALRDNVADFMRRAQRRKGTRTAPVLTNLRKYLERISTALADDLGTPQALSHLFELVADVNRRRGTLTRHDYRAVCDALTDIDMAFGLKLTQTRDEEASSNVHVLIEERERARQEKRWNDADRLREEVVRAGYRVEDTADGTNISRIEQR